LIEKYKKLDEIPFDFTRRMMSVLVESPEGNAILLTKGAPEEIFHQCSQFELDGKLSPMVSHTKADEYDFRPLP
jgi:Mg2+-importing ATPase